ncbi:hypothetical protein [Kitasatospora sp. MMS16-BH015]|uniref:hypothetical protein n=1 Tax=Kitasatospora sp. MMS16-BH015 TaxID=2018025 RepID=UPI000CF28013|nr:hypothetical protein [Kitasatospora sp. MMS16-BH015]
MFRSKPGDPVPHIPTDAEQLAAYGGRVAMLVAPPAEWIYVLGRSGQNGLVYQLDVTYATPGQNRLLVATARPSVRHPSLAEVLTNFAMNAQDLPRGVSIPEWLDGWDFVRHLETTATSLRVDGSEVAGRRMAFEGFFGVELELTAEELVFVCGRAEIEELARELVTGTELRGMPYPRPPWAS